MKHLRFEDLPKAIETVIEKITLMQEELENIKKNYQPKEPVELMTRQEVADYFKISFPTLHQWTKNGILSGYRTGNRVYYIRSEVENRLIRIT